MPPAAEHPPVAPPPVSAHFVNNVLAAAASYIDEDPDYARDVLAELGQFLSYRLREAPGDVTASQELTHVGTYLRLQQARFPDRITFTLPEVGTVGGRVTPGAVQRPLADAVGARLRERPGPLSVSLTPAPGSLVLSLAGADGSAEQVTIALPEGAPA